MNVLSKTKPLIKIGMPILAGMLVGQIQRITDQAFLGQVNGEYLSAIGNASFTMWTSVSFLYALGTGAIILVSQCIGAGKEQEAEDILGSTFVYSSIFSFIIFGLWFLGSREIFSLMSLQDPVLGYAALYAKIYSFSILLTGLSTTAQAAFQGTGHTRPMMIYAIIRCLINILLDWVLIFGHFGFPAMGIAGSAIGTLASDIIGICYFLPAAFSKKLPAGISFEAIKRASFKKYASVIRIGLPYGMEEILWNTGNIILLKFLNEIDQTAAGVYTLVMAIYMIPTLFFISIGNASMTLSGISTGRGDPKEIKTTGNNAIALSMGAALVFAGIFIVFPEFITSFFTKDTGMINQACQMLLICSVALFPRAANLIYGGTIRGMGDTKWMFMSQMFGTVFVLFIARILMFTFSMAITGLFLAVCLDEIVRATINGGRFYAKIRKKMAQLKIA